MPATFPLRTPGRTVSRAAAVVLLPVLLAAAVRAPAADPGAPAPLPPPPELLGGMPFEMTGPLPESAPADPEETRRALAPPAALGIQPEAQPAYQIVTSAPSPAAAITSPAPSPAPAPVQVMTVRAPLRDLTISPPSRYMPDEYFELPIEDTVIPGVVMPELDRTYLARMGGRPAPTGRPVSPGMSIRQLEPYFALAKGSEAVALEAGRKGEEPVYREQLTKAIDAYMAIIDMADASTEAREEAWYGLARCEYRRGNWWQAFDALERSFPKKFERSEVAGRIKLEMFVGERLWRMGGEPVPGANPEGTPLTGYQAASRVYAAAIFNQPTAKDAPLALLRRGDAAAMDKNWQEAAKYYRQVVEYYPESDQAMQARSSLTESIYRQDWPGGFPEAARSDVALIMDDVERADTRLSGEAQERRTRAVTLANENEAETKLRHAKEYLKKVRTRKSRDGAVFLLGDVVSYYPNTPQAAEAAEILRGLGLEPPMTVSDGSRFPITAGASGAGMPAGQDGVFGPGGGGGFIELGGQDDIGGGALPPSPTRETVFETMSIPGAGSP